MAAIAAATASCNTSALDISWGLYNITVDGTTVFDVAAETNRGVCDICRHNLMADVTIPPNFGEQFIIPPQVCEPDNETCLLPNTTRTRTCIYGGPRLYYTVNGDTHDIVARRLNITTDSLIGQDESNTSTTDALPVGQFLKMPLCEPSECVIKPFSFEFGVYKDLADKYGSTVGQIMALSPTYNYSSIAFMPDGTWPPISVAYNCKPLSDNITVID
jgi:hypothetical protein